MHPSTHNRNLEQAAREFVRLHLEKQRATELLKRMMPDGALTVSTSEGRWELSTRGGFDSVVVRRI